MFISDIKKKIKEKMIRNEVEISEKSSENRQAADPVRMGKRYLIAAVIIAAAAQVYGLFSHGVHSAFMTYAFLVPLLGGALPYFAADYASDWEKLSGFSYKVKEEADNEHASDGSSVKTGAPKWDGIKDIQLALISTLTVGSLLKGALDIYGTTNRLLIAYPVTAVVIIAAGVAMYVRGSRASEANSSV